MGSAFGAGADEGSTGGGGGGAADAEADVADRGALREPRDQRGFGGGSGAAGALGASTALAARETAGGGGVGVGVGAADGGASGARVAVGASAASAGGDRCDHAKAAIPAPPRTTAAATAIIGVRVRFAGRGAWFVPHPLAVWVTRSGGTGIPSTGVMTVPVGPRADTTSSMSAVSSPARRPLATGGSSSSERPVRARGEGAGEEEEGEETGEEATSPRSGWLLLGARSRSIEARSTQFDARPLPKGSMPRASATTLAGRSLGSPSRQRITTASSSFGQSGRSSDRGMGSGSRTAAQTSPIDSPANGTVPVRSS